MTATATKAVWIVVQTLIKRARSRANLELTRPPMPAPMPKAPSAAIDAGIENPRAPTRAKARKTTFPVMLATKT